MNLSVLYQIRGIVSQYVKRFEPIIKIGLKFIAFLVIYQVIASSDVYTGTGVFNSFWIHLIMALVATLLPSRIGVLLALALCVYNIFLTSLIGAIIVGVMMLILYVAVARMFPDQIYFLILVPICIQWNFYLLPPLFAGLYLGAIAVVPVVVGILMWGLIQIVPAFMSLQMGESLDALPQMISDASSYGIDQITKNEQMVYLLIISAILALVVSLVKKLHLDYAHYIAIGAGGVLGIICLIMGKVIVGLSGNLIVMVLLAIITIAGLAALEFLNLAVNYKRVQNLEFEDEEYFYQVRLIPKLNPVKKTKKEVKNITETQEQMGQTRVGGWYPSRKAEEIVKARPARRPKGESKEKAAGYKPLRRSEAEKTPRPAAQPPKTSQPPKAAQSPKTVQPAARPEKPKAKSDEEATDLFDDFKA